MKLQFAECRQSLHSNKTATYFELSLQEGLLVNASLIIQELENLVLQAQHQLEKLLWKGKCGMQIVFSYVRYCV